jgi:hypothetical protein
MHHNTARPHPHTHTHTLSLSGSELFGMRVSRNDFTSNITCARRSCGLEHLLSSVVVQRSDLADRGLGTLELVAQCLECPCGWIGFAQLDDLRSFFVAELAHWVRWLARDGLALQQIDRQFVCHVQATWNGVCLEQLLWRVIVGRITQRRCGSGGGGGGGTVVGCGQATSKHSTRGARCYDTKHDVQQQQQQQQQQQRGRNKKEGDFIKCVSHGNSCPPASLSSSCYRNQHTLPCPAVQSRPTAPAAIAVSLR